ncbi:MAG: nucleotidyltransferase family protein [Acidobacteriia bacterium]|nr:nucleotidyltransferase family protein [Terriglobia bacterium]
MPAAEIAPVSGTSFGPEWALLLAACSVSPKREALDCIPLLLTQLGSWKSVLSLADKHGVLSLLHQALSRGACEVPVEVLRELKDRYHANLHKSLFLSRELIRILDCLGQLGIEAMPYKGLALAEQIYGDMALRQSGDIDLLIRPQDLSRIKEAVRDLGYTPHDQLSPAEERAYLRSGYECSFDSPAGRNLLEVQWAIQPRFYTVEVDMEALFQRGVTVTVAGRPMKTLSPEDQILILSVHAAKHVWGRLIWLCDIARIAQLPNLNWKWIEREATTLGIARILRVTFDLARRFAHSPVPASLRTTEDQQASALADEVAVQFVSGNAPDVESLAYFRLMMRLRERRADRMRFLRRLALTPGPNEWKAVRLPASLFPLYRLVRLSRLAARFARI